MIKKTIKYEDYNGNEREEEFYFNLSNAELTKMELGVEGGLSERLKKVLATKDTPQILKVFEEIINKAYGVKSDDGKRFIKSKELLEEFTQTEAYSQLFVELATNENAAQEFILGILPKKLSDEVKKQNVVSK